MACKAAEILKCRGFQAPADGSSRGVRQDIRYLNESYFQKRGVCTYIYVHGFRRRRRRLCAWVVVGLSIALGLRELRLEGLAADERVLVGDRADDGLAPVPHQGIPNRNDFGGDGGGVDVVADPIAANIL